ncbi:MAG: acyltransferase family protein [Lachnospiraceae bacterium]|nr:acyltransferase family protein [Lachnospiraceae bacterium]
MKKKVYLEWVRVIAILLVIFNHSDLYYTFYSNTDNLITFICSLLTSTICRINVPLFMMVTGALLISREEDWKMVIKKRVVRMVMVLVLFSFLLYCLQCLVWNQGTFSLINFGQRLMQKDIQPSYWYLYEYLGILLLLPFNRVLARNLSENMIRYLLILCSILKVGGAFANTLGLLVLPIDLFILNDSVFYILMGYYLENRIEESRYSKLSYGTISLGILVGIILTSVLVVGNRQLLGGYQEAVLDVFRPIIVIPFFALIKKMGIACTNKSLQDIIEKIGGCVFGMYLVEHIGQKIFLPLYLVLCEKTFGVIACCIYVMCIFAFSLSLTLVLRKVPGVKYLLG